MRPGIDRAAARALDRLASLPPGVHHTVADGGVWVMIGRALPSEFSWSSVPPAQSVSFVWGAGGCSVHDRSGEMQLRAGQLLVMDRGHPHSGVGFAGSDWVTLFLPEDADPSGDELGSQTFGGVVPMAPAQLDRLLAFVDAVMADERSESIRRLSVDLAAELDRMRPADVERDDGEIDVARQLLLASFRDGVAIDDLARRAGISARQLFRSFAARWELTPIQFRKQLRLLEATRWLERGATVTEAAHGAGFADAAHLSRTFKRQYRITPSAWQRLRCDRGVAPRAP